MKLHVYNPTQFKRTQAVLFGSKESYNIFEQTAVSNLNVAFVTVPPFYKGEVYGDSNTPEGFLLSHAVFYAFADEDISARFAPYLEIDSRKAYFKLVNVKTSANGSYTIGDWELKHDSINARLWTFYGKQDDIMRFELVYYSETLHELRKKYSIRLGIDTPFVHVVSREKPLSFNDSFVDAGGQKIIGSFLFWRFLEDNDSRSDTLLAEFHYPLYALHRWKEWGPWGKVPVEINAQEFRRQLAEKSFVNWKDPFVFPGYILNKTPGDTGAQAGFGTWQHIATVGHYDSSQMLLDQLVCGQESCRPNHFFDPDGSPLDISKHPNFVSWNELPHYHNVVSSDQLGRTRGWKLTSNDWRGHDRQHYGNIWLAEDVILNGSRASKFELDMKANLLIAGLTLPSVKPRWSTNSALSGRGAGRILLNVVYNWMATNNLILMRHIEKHIKEIDSKHNLQRIICNDNRVFGKGLCGWMVWEDALAVMGWGALYQAFKKLSWDTSFIKSTIEVLGNRVVQHGWHPSRNIIAKQIRLDKVPLTVAQWEDNSLVHLATQTEYHIWAAPCLMLSLLSRSVELLTAIKLNPNQASHHVYMGVKK